MSEEKRNEEVVVETSNKTASFLTSIWGLILCILISLNAFLILSSNIRHAMITCLFFGVIMEVFLVLGVWLSYFKLKKQPNVSKPLGLINVGIIIYFAVCVLTCFLLLGYLIYFTIYLKDHTLDQLIYRPFIIAMVVVVLLIVLEALIFLVFDKFVKNVKRLIDGSEQNLKTNKYCLVACLGLKAVIGFVIYILPLILIPRLHKFLEVRDTTGQINGFIDLYHFTAFNYASGICNILLFGYLIFVVIKFYKVLNEK